MSTGIAPIATPLAAHPTPPDPRVEKLRHAAGEFESILVKQLLKAAKIGGGDENSSGYADMAVDALSSAIERGGGLGLAHQIEQAMSHTLAPGTSNTPKGG
jgi:Rod binding domain-containing protein